MTRTSWGAPTRRWVLLGAWVAANLYVSVVVTLAAWVLVPVAFGWTPVAIVSGSMGPLIRSGDVVIIAPYEDGELHQGAVVTFDDPAHLGRLVTHRVVEQLADGSYRTRGDANPTADSTPLTPSAIRGTGRIVVPAAARPVLWHRSGRLAPLTAWVLTTALAIAANRLGHPERQREATRAGRHADRVRTASTPGRPEPSPQAQHVPAPLRTRHSSNSGWQTQQAAPLPVVWHARCALSPTPSHRRATPVARRRVIVVLTILVVATLQIPALAFSASTDSSGNAWQAGYLQPPMLLTATTSCHTQSGKAKVTLEWSAPGLGVSPDGYDVYRSHPLNDAFQKVAWVSGGSVTTYIDGGVNHDATYWYRLQSTRGGWTSADSNELSALTPLCL